MVRTLTPGITVCIPSIPPRHQMREKAVRSVSDAAESLDRGIPVQVIVQLDEGGQGAAITRQKALESVTTKWTAFLDDDDLMDPWHLRLLYEAAHAYQAQYVWSRFRIGLPGGRFRPGPEPLGAGTFDQWNDEQPAQTTVTTLVRTELALDVGGFNQHALPGEDTIDGQRAGEDWLFTLACRAAGARFRHVPHVTWIWNHHASNTSGLPDRW